MEKKFMFIYETINKITGERYIGKHSSETINDDYLGSGRYLKEAIQAYGKENFERKIICFANSEEELHQKELEEIKERNAQYDPQYYNAYPLKGKFHPAFGAKRTEEAKEKMRKAKEGMFLGENNPHFGKKHTEEAKKRMSEKRKGRGTGSKNPKAKPPVLCVETGEIYECATFAGNALHCDRHWIADCCQGKRETAKGFHWQYLTENLNVNTVPSPAFAAEGVSTILQRSSAE